MRRALAGSSRIAALTISVALLASQHPAAQAVKPSNAAPALQRVKYNHPGLVVDLGVGLWAWPLPMDWDSDGDMDLVVSCPDVPYNGTYFFENPGDGGGASETQHKFPVFKPAKRLGPGLHNVQVSFVDGQPRVLTPATEWLDFLGRGFDANRQIYPRSNVQTAKVRANQWRYVDYDGDGALDLVVGADDWAEYGWDDAYDEDGNWTRGPLHGYVYLLRNDGTNNEPRYRQPVKVEAAGQPVDVYGMPSPNFADFDADGDLDLLCGEFLDGFTYFQNIGSRTSPRYAAGRRLARGDQPIRMDLQMITPTAVDWDRDGDIDLIVGDEDGRVAFIEHTGRVENGMPRFNPPRYFQQQADALKFGALATPVGCDWDRDGDDDLICGNTAGYIGFFENLGGGFPPQWAAPVLLEAGGQVIRIQAGANGSIQGPAEAKWGYTTLDVADWDHDRLDDLVVNSIWGRVVWFRNIGTPTEPRLAESQALEVAWPAAPPKPQWTWWNPAAGELATQWRSTPVVVDWNNDGLNDLVMLDQEGYLAWFERDRRGDDLVLLPPARVFRGMTYGRKHTLISSDLGPLRLNAKRAGRSGRRKFSITDWDGDGRRDLLVDSTSVNFLRAVSPAQGTDHTTFEDAGPVADIELAGHSTSPTTVDWNRDGLPDLVIGAEDGHFYYVENPRTRSRAQQAARGVPRQQPGLVHTEFIFREAPFPQCHASTIAQTDDGLIAAWFGGTREKHPDVGIWLSRRVEGKWTEPVEVANGIQSPDLRYPTWNPVFFQPTGGPLMLFYKVGPSPEEWWGMLMTSGDGGRSWSQPRRLPDGILGPVKNKPVELPGGDILAPSSTEHDGWRVHFERSTDGGKTWQATPPAGDGRTIQAIQPSILLHRSGRLQALGRTKAHGIFSIWSDDNGRTWGEMTNTGLPNPSAGTDAVTLADGRHLLVYNHNTQPRSRGQFNVAVSHDGKTWHAALVLENEPGSEFSYPAVIETRDGLVHITYTWKRDRIKHVVLDPTKFKLRPIQNGTWPSL